MAIEGRVVERPPAVLIRRGGLRPTRCQVLCNREEALLGGKVERTCAVLKFRRDGIGPPFNRS